MRTRDWKSPVGDEHLYEMLAIAKPQLEEADYNERIIYHYGHSTFDGKPSYELVVFYGNMEIFAAVYVLDSRFNSQVNPKERTRVQNLLAAYAVSVIAACGIIHCIASAEEGHLITSITKEVNDKDFMSLQ